MPEPASFPPPSRLEREAAVGRLAAELGHEMMNLLAVFGAWTKLLATASPSHTSPHAAEAPARLDAALERLTRLTQAFHLASSGTLGNMRRPLGLPDIVAHARELTAPKLRTTGVELSFEPGGTVGLGLGNIGQWVMALTLVLRRTAALGAASLTLSAADAPSGAGLRLAASTGTTPFADDDPDAAFAAGLAAELGGSLRFGSAAEDGAVATLWLPAGKA